MYITDAELETLKVGDPVWVERYTLDGWKHEAGVIVRMPKTRIVVALSTGGEMRFKRDGREEGTGYNGSSLLSTNAEVVAGFKQQQRADKLRKHFRELQWGKVELAKLELIYQILNPKPEG